MRKKLLPILLAMAAVLSLAACSEAPVMPEPQTSRAAPEKPELVDDFYGNMNYDYLANGQIPYGENGYGYMDNIRLEMMEDLRELIDRCVNSEPASGSLEEMVKEIYLQYMDREGREKAGADALMMVVGMIEQCTDINDLVSAMGFLYQNYGVRSLFGIDVHPNSNDTSENIVFFMNYNTMGNMKENFTKTDAGPEAVGKIVEDTLKILNVLPNEAKERARNSVKLMNEIMLVSRDQEDIYDFDSQFNEYDMKKLRKLFSNIDTENMLRSFGIKTDKFIVYDERQAEKINELLTNENIRAIKDYIYGCIMFDYSQVLPPTYLDKGASVSDFEKDADESAKRYVFNILEHELGVLYGKEVCTQKVMNVTEKMVKTIQDSCRSLISKCDRLSQDSKDKYLKKLDNMEVLLGYEKDLVPPFAITKMKNGGNLLENVIAIKRGRVQEALSSAGKPADRSKWQMSAIEVNATYYPTSNKIEIPAVMMGRYCIDPDDDEYYNLGILGYVVGHEINHGFDSNGFLFDEFGNYRPKWINKADQEKYRELMDRVKEYYNNIKILGVYPINGTTTLSENIADLAAVQCILNSAKNKDDYQSIFEGIATQWASLTCITELVMTLSGDVHSPAEARVNAVVASMDEFYEVYDIKEGDKMYVAPENRVKVW